MSTYDRLVALAAENHGLFRKEEAVAAGAADKVISDLLRARRIERLTHGLYRVLALPEDRLTPYMEAVLWAGGRGVISHASALEMLELCDVFPRKVHITVPERYNPRKAGRNRFEVHRHDLPNTDLTWHEGVPVVTAYRAIHQSIHAGEDPEQLRLAVRHATREGLLIRSEAARLRRSLNR